jgi:predicted aspartyl protease
LLALALVITAASPASAALYRWVDGAGAVHYTSEQDAIPQAYRGSAETLEHPSARTSEPVALATPGAAISVPTGSPVMVDALLNGVPLRLLLDTGADRTVISPAALGRAGYDTVGGTPVRITGVTGSSTALLVTVPRLDVAGAQIGPLGVIAHAVPGEGLDGLLGRDVLDAFTVTFDAAGNRATLAPR